MARVRTMPRSISFAESHGNALLVSAFAGRELAMHAYRVAIEQEYRFYSYGDAMLIL